MSLLKKPLVMLFLEAVNIAVRVLLMLKKKLNVKSLVLLLVSNNVVTFREFRIKRFVSLIVPVSL
jgi:hypothetical protein